MYTPLRHLQASSLSKAEQQHRTQAPDSSEALRTGPVVDNQALMIATFERLTRTTTLSVVFDGHTLIAGRDGPFESPVTVFAALSLDAIAFLAADPAVIFERRRLDPGRDRLIRELATLGSTKRISFGTRRLVGKMSLGRFATRVPVG